MIFYALSNAADRVSLRGPEVELEEGGGGSQEPSHQVVENKLFYFLSRMTTESIYSVSHFAINLELRYVYFVHNVNIRFFGISSAFKGARAHSKLFL